MITILQHLLMIAGAVISALFVGGLILLLWILLNEEFNKLFADLRRQHTIRN